MQRKEHAAQGAFCWPDQHLRIRKGTNLGAGNPSPAFCSASSRSQRRRSPSGRRPALPRPLRCAQGSSHATSMFASEHVVTRSSFRARGAPASPSSLLYPESTDWLGNVNPWHECCCHCISSLGCGPRIVGIRFLAFRRAFFLPLSAAALKANPWISQHRLARQMSLPSISSRLGASKRAFFDGMMLCLGEPVAHVAEINFATVEIEVVEHFLQ